MGKNKYSIKGKDHIYGLLKDGRILQIKKKGERCFFLKGKICSIYPVRPTICRLYPFWFKSNKNDIKIITCIGYENVCIIPEQHLKIYKNNNAKLLISIARGYKKEIEEYKKEVLNFVNEKYGKKN